MNARLHAYRVKCAGLEYIALASSSCMAIEQAIELHGVAGASALRLTGGAA